MELLWHIRRRCLAVGWASVLVFIVVIGLLISGNISEWPPPWYGKLFAVYCLAGLAILALSAQQLRETQKCREHDAELLKKAESSCWTAVASCVLFGGWTALDLLFFDPVHAGTTTGLCLGFMLGNSFWAAQALTKVLRRQSDAPSAPSE